MSDKPGQDDTIRAKRRRQGASQGPQSRERAEAPARQRPGGGPGEPRRPTGGGFGGGGAGGGGTTGRNAPKLPLWMILLIGAGFLLYSLLGGGGGDDTLPTEDPFQAAPVQPTRTPEGERVAATRSPSGAAAGDTWTVMLYQDADDQILEQDIYLDLNEAERVGSSDRVQIVAQIDRFKGGYSGDADWTTTRRYHIEQDDDLQNVASLLEEDLGELNMADGSTLVDFITWSAENYPADRYALILSDHGMGWPGGFSDPDPAGQDPSGIALASALSADQLFMMELEDSLAEGLRRANIEKLDLVGMDACLMGHLEVVSALEPYAHYAVLSQETEPALGWAYSSFLRDLVDNPEMSTAELSERILGSYITDDERINDAQARAEFLRQGSPMGGLFGSAGQMSAESLARQLEHGVTLTAVDLANVPALVESVNNLAYNLQNENEETVARARTYAPAFTNVFGRDTPSPYIDLGGFVSLLQQNGVGANTGQAADQVLAAIQDAVVAERHGDGKRGATGISIYFPNSTLYRSPVAGVRSYTAAARRFAEVSLWDNFLVYFYNDIGFDPEPEAITGQPPNTPSRAPGQGDLQLSEVTLSSQTAAPGQPVTVSTRVTGRNIGYIYLFVGLYDQSASSIFKADTDYLESPTTQQVNGVFYPVWNDGQPFNLEFDWEPTLFQISDGQNTTVALFTPQSYGADAQDAVYTVDGIYHYADGSSRSAQLIFRDGAMRQVFGYTDEDQTGGVREIIPQAGDRFTILEKWLDVDSSGQVSQQVSEEGATLTFGSRPFEWSEAFAPEGDYLIGVIVQDLDGATREAYTTVTVR